MLLLKVSWTLLSLFFHTAKGYSQTFSPNGTRSGPQCTSGMDMGTYLVLGRGIISLDQTLALRTTDINTVYCFAAYPIDFEMTGVTTQLMHDDVRSEYKVGDSSDGISYGIQISLTNLMAPRRFTFYKLDNKTMYTTFFVLRHGKVAFPDKGQIVTAVKSDREILTLPCIVSDPNPTNMSLKLKKLVNETKIEDSNQTTISEGRLVRTTKKQINILVEDEFPWNKEYLHYDKTQGFLLNTTYFRDSFGDFSCIYTSSNQNSSEERFPITILPPRDHEVEPEQNEVVVFQNQKLRLSCRHTEEVILKGTFNGSYINIPSIRSSYSTHLPYHAEYNLEKTIIGDSDQFSCVLKRDKSVTIHSWTINSFDMWKNSKLNLIIGSKRVQCKSSEATPKLSYILCSSEGNCRHRLACFLPDNSCPSSERVKHGNPCGSNRESCIDFPIEEGFVQGAIGCNIGNTTAWTHFVKALDGKIYTDWRSAPASSMMEIVVPREKLYAEGKFSFVCRFNTFIADGDVKWFYRQKNETAQDLHEFLPDDRKYKTIRRYLLKLKFSMTHIICSVRQWDGKATWNVSQRITVEKTEVPSEKSLGHSKNPIFVKSQTSRSISCAAQGLPQPKIKWFKFNQGMMMNLPKEFQQIQTNNEDNTVELRFPKIDDQHEGVYVCNASNVIGVVLQNFTVQVKDKKDPKFDNETIHRIVYIGDSPDIECIVEGYPRPTITWTYPKAVNRSKHPIIRDSGLKTMSSIRLHSISKNDEGVYECTATISSEFGTAAASQKHVVEVQERSSPLTAIIIGASIAIVALLIPLVIVFWRLQVAKKEIRDLTTEEVEDFFNGNPNEAKRVENIYTDDIQGIQSSLFSSLPYNKDFEITKDSLNIDENKRLGEGAFGMVLCASIKGKPVAVKTVKPNSEVSYFKALLSELKIMIYIEKHPNVVNLIGAYTENIKKRELYIAVELCQHGSLEKFLQGISKKQLFRDEIENDDVVFPYVNDRTMSRDALMQKGLEDGDDTVSTSDLIRWSYQIANGMSYLASKKVIHSDLSTRNVLLHEDGTVRITDFGLSRQLYDYTQYVKKNQTPLPWRWMAIESLRNMSFSSQSDVWAFGVTMWEIFSLADVPYPGRSWTVDFVEELTNGLRMKKPRYATCHIYNIMYDCWMAFPENRPTFSDLMTSIFKVAYGERLNIFD